MREILKITYRLLVRKKFNLYIIIEKPAEIVKKMENQECIEKKDVFMSCLLSKENLAVKWYKNDELIEQDNKFKFIQDWKKYKLYISEVALTDAAEYKLKYEELESTALLTVEGKLINKPSHISEL